jgi:hypothetical protein
VDFVLVRGLDFVPFGELDFVPFGELDFVPFGGLDFVLLGLPEGLDLTPVGLAEGLDSTPLGVAGGGIAPLGLIEVQVCDFSLPTEVVGSEPSLAADFTTPCEGLAVGLDFGAAGLSPLIASSAVEAHSPDSSATGSGNLLNSIFVSPPPSA